MDMQGKVDAADVPWSVEVAGSRRRTIFGARVTIRVAVSSYSSEQMKVTFRPLLPLLCTLSCRCQYHRLLNGTSGEGDTERASCVRCCKHHAKATSKQTVFKFSIRLHGVSAASRGEVPLQRVHTSIDPEA